MKTRHLSSYFCFSYKSIISSGLVCWKNISLAVSFYAKAESAMSRVSDVVNKKAESAMSRISDVVNKIMQISGEMNNSRFLQFS